MAVIDLLSGYSPLAVLALGAAGTLVGMVGGLLGIGGGVIIVPVLIEILAAQGLPAEARTPLAIGTAHAAVLLASVSATLAHARSGRVDRALVGAWLPPMLAGMVAGIAVAQVVAPGVLLGIFAAVASVLGVTLLGPGGGGTGRMRDLGRAAPVPPFLVGALAAALGIGGGTLSGPSLALLSVPLPRVIGAGAVFNISVALPCTIFFVWTGLGAAGLPAGSLGYVSLLPLLALTVPALAVSPWAARLAPRVPVSVLRRIFAVCLLLIAARVVLQVLAG